MVNKKKNARDEKGKRCSRCKKTKPRTSTYFSKNKHYPDGFSLSCKVCQKEYRCGLELDSGYRDGPEKKTRRNIPETYGLHGLECTCKKCKKMKKQIYKNQQGRGKANGAEVLGIQDWSQADSVLREMAELQSCISEEEVMCEKRISMIRKYSEEAIIPWLAHRVALQIMLRDFLRKDGGKNFVCRRRFGVIEFSRCQLKIKLNLSLAKRRMGLP